MKIAIDISQISRDSAGVNNYLRGVINALAAQPRSDIEIILCGRQKEDSLPAEFKQLIIPSVPKYLGGGLTWYRRLAKKLEEQQVDLLISVTMNFAPMFFPTLMIIHDLSPLTHGITFEWSLRWRFWLSTQITRRYASKIATVTQSTKDVFMQKFPRYQQDIIITGEGLANWVRTPISKQKQAEVRQKLDLPEKYYFSLGTVQPRKNYVRAIEAFAKIRNEDFNDMHYVIGGAKGWAVEQILANASQLGVADRVHFLGFVDEAALPHIFDAAQGFVQVSLDEGFGLPLIEARARGVPILCSDIPAFRELELDTVPVWIDPKSVDSITRGMRELRTKQHEPATAKFLRTYSWDNTAKIILDFAQT